MEIIRRRRLPHWDVPDAPYFVTTCLEGSIPAQGWLDVRRYRDSLEQRRRPAKMNEADWKLHKWKLGFARMEEWLDEKPAVRHLADERLAREVVKSVYHFAGQHYDLLAFVVMPSHIHWVFQPRREWVAGLKVGPVSNRPEGEAKLETGKLETCPTTRTPRERIVHSLNRFTAAACNRILGLRGAFWQHEQHESYDHWVRDAEELERIMLYVEANPVKAGLARTVEDWLFSSAHDRRVAGIEFGVPLTRFNTFKAGS